MNICGYSLLSWGAVLSIIECLAASLVSAQWTAEVSLLSPKLVVTAKLDIASASKVSPVEDHWIMPSPRMTPRPPVQVLISLQSLCVRTLCAIHRQRDSKLRSGLGPLSLFP